MDFRAGSPKIDKGFSRWLESAHQSGRTCPPFKHGEPPWPLPSNQPAPGAGDGWSPPCWSCFSPSPPRLRPILADRPRSYPCFPWEVGRERSFRQPSGGVGWRVLVNSGSTPAVSGQPFSACGTRRVPNLKRGPSRTPGTSRCSCSACGSRWIPPLNRAPETCGRSRLAVFPTP